MTVNFAGLDELAEHIAVYVQSVPHPVIEAQMRLAAMDFFERTRSWRHVETIALAGQDVSLASFSDYAQLVDLEFAEFDGRRLAPTPFADVDPVLFSSAAGGAAFGITQVDPNTFRVFPSSTGPLRISVFLKPTPSSQVIPLDTSWLFGHHIADGAAARILAIPSQPYSNPQLAAMFQQRFDSACGRLSAFNIKGQQRAPIRTRSSFF